MVLQFSQSNASGADCRVRGCRYIRKGGLQGALEAIGAGGKHGGAEAGAVLVFLPGTKEIDDVQKVKSAHPDPTGGSKPQNWFFSGSSQHAGAREGRRSTPVGHSPSRLPPARGAASRLRAPPEGGDKGCPGDERGGDLNYD